MSLKSLSIKNISYNFAWYLSKYQHQNHIQRNIYYYASQVIIGGILKIFLLFTITYGLGILKESFLCLLVFGSIRIYAGGFHSDTYFKCLLYTSAIIISISFFSVSLIAFYSLYLNILFFLIALYVVYRKSPYDTPNKPIISIEHKNFLKIKSLLIIILWFAISTTVLTNNYNIKIPIIISLTTLMESITLTDSFKKAILNLESFCANILHN